MVIVHFVCWFLLSIHALTNYMHAQRSRALSFSLSVSSFLYTRFSTASSCRRERVFFFFAVCRSSVPRCFPFFNNKFALACARRCRWNLLMEEFCLIRFVVYSGLHTTYVHFLGRVSVVGGAFRTGRSWWPWIAYHHTNDLDVQTSDGITIASACHYIGVNKRRWRHCRTQVWRKPLSVRAHITLLYLRQQNTLPNQPYFAPAGSSIMLRLYACVSFVPFRSFYVSLFLLSIFISMFIFE